MEEKQPQPEQRRVDFAKVQKRIEQEIGAYVVQHCIKDVLIEELQAELNSYKLGVIQPNGVIREGRPVSGHGEELILNKK